MMFAELARIPLPPLAQVGTNTLRMLAPVLLVVVTLSIGKQERTS